MSLDIEDTPAVARKEKKGKRRRPSPTRRHRELIDWIVSQRLRHMGRRGRQAQHPHGGLAGSGRGARLERRLQDHRHGQGTAGRPQLLLLSESGRRVAGRAARQEGHRGQGGRYLVAEPRRLYGLPAEQGREEGGRHRGDCRPCTAHYNFFHFEDEAYVEVERRGHPEVLLVEEDTFRRLLRILTTRHLKIVALNEWLKNAIDQLAAHALEEGPEYPVFVRLAQHDGKVYLDLCDRERTVIEVDGDGWRVCADSAGPVLSDQDHAAAEDARERRHH